MARYIDATPIEEKLKEAINIGNRNDDEGYYELIPVLEDIQGTPTADVVERKRGKWLAIGNTCLAACECGFITDRCSMYKFCPNCGAEMEKR